MRYILSVFVLAGASAYGQDVLSPKGEIQVRACINDPIQRIPIVGAPVDFSTTVERGSCAHAHYESWRPAGIAKPSFGKTGLTGCTDTQYTASEFCGIETLWAQGAGQTKFVSFVVGKDTWWPLPNSASTAVGYFLVPDPRHPANKW